MLRDASRRTVEAVLQLAAGNGWTIAGDGQSARLAQAIALRDEATRLQVDDGGTLSPAHLACLRRQAALIEGGGSTAKTGSSITRR